uniref:Uncharacterized protein LOC104227641 n=1 Tax=Nicotiana sylvestris TaxID=4096 RepID=A0A1U7WU48_NICSY|nr:PREDICTED: uncharacterized protein LOC104227641 [Nicotiana sylvestris]
MDALPDFEEGRSTYRPPRFQKMVSRNGGIPKKGSSSRNTKGYDCCHKCRKPGHFITDCPLHKQVHYKHNADKVGKRNLVPDRKFKRRDVADNIVKQALAVWGDSSSESEGDNEKEDTSMVAVESKATKYDFIFALMAKSDEDEEEDDDEILINDKDSLTVELGEAEQTRDDLVVVVVDLKETIKNLKKDKDALDEKIVNVDLKETIEVTEDETPADIEESGPSITTSKAENRVVDDNCYRSQAPHAWCERLSKFLLKNGFTKGKIDNTLFLKKRGSNLLIVQIYFEGIIFGATVDSQCEEFAKLMGSELEMSTMGN